MKLRVDRFSADPETTLGCLYIDDGFECWTLEDQEQLGAKVHGDTRIPAGTYQIKLRPEGGKNASYTEYYAKRKPDWHKGMLHVQNVPGFEYVLIHVGNTDADTEGCLLVGAGRDRNTEGHQIVSQSRSAYEHLYPRVRDRLLANEEVTIEINDRPKTAVPGMGTTGSRPGAAAGGAVIAGGAIIAGTGKVILDSLNEKPETPVEAAPAPDINTPTPIPPPQAPTPLPPTHAETGQPAPLPPVTNYVLWGIAALGAIVVLLGLYLLIHRYREWRRKRSR